MGSAPELLDLGMIALYLVLLLPCVSFPTLVLFALTQ